MSLATVLSYREAPTLTLRPSLMSALHLVWETCTAHRLFPCSGPTSVPQFLSRGPDRSHAEPVQRSIPNRDASNQLSSSFRLRPSSATIDASSSFSGKVRLRERLGGKRADGRDRLWGSQPASDYIPIPPMSGMPPPPWEWAL